MAFDQIGMCVGAALHDACAIVGAMMVADCNVLSEPDIVSEVETYARHFYHLSERLKVEFKAEADAIESEKFDIQQIKRLLTENKDINKALIKAEKEDPQEYCLKVYADNGRVGEKFIAAMRDELEVKETT